MSAQDTKLAEALEVLQPAAKTILASRPMDFTDATYEGFPPILDQPMREVLRVYEGTNHFLRDVRGKNNWTLRQSRAVANILRRELRGEGGSKPGQDWKCFGCGDHFPSKTVLMDHKRWNCPVTGKSTPSQGVEPQTTVPVLPDFQPVHSIDLRLFPAARYAVEDSTGTLRFIIITELKRRTRLAGRFVWTKFRYANEYLDKGDRTVREQAGDTKKLIGKQRNADPVYFGEEEDLIKAISENPAEAMLRYGKEMHRCAYCGRSLTDTVSRERGIGPDCWEEKHVPYIMGEVRRQASANGWGKPSGSPVAL